MTTVVKPIMSADISIMMSSAAMRAMPRSPTKRMTRRRCARIRDRIGLPVPVDKREIAEAHDRGQMIPNVIALPHRHRLGSDADVDGGFPNHIRRVGDARCRVRQIPDVG